MVRLVFRPYTQVRRSICTLESLRASTRVSPGFALLRDSSPSFGSRQVCSHSNLSPEGSWSVGSACVSEDKQSYLRSPRLPLPSLRAVGSTQSTRTHVRLLGPCFKTGCRGAFRQDQFDKKPRSLSRRSKHCLKSAQQTLSRKKKPTLAQIEENSRSTRPTTNPNHLYTAYHYFSFSASSGTFNSLFKVLFIFPSRYLFAIGLPPVFSFRWNLPPTLCCSPKQHDSSTRNLNGQIRVAERGYHPLRRLVPENLNNAHHHRLPHLQVTTLLRDSKPELFPLHSPLLGESLLVSFPPLSYMLKFSGSSCLTET